MSEQEQRVLDLLQGVRRKLSAVTLFVLLNGMIVAFIAFVLLHFKTQEMRLHFARQETKDLSQQIEQSVDALEKNVKALTLFYSSVVVGTDFEENVASNIKQILQDNEKIHGLLWTTAKGVWLHENLFNDVHATRYDAAFGWPTYDDLQRESFAYEYNQINILTETKWNLFKPQNGRPDISNPILILMKSKLPDGSTGLLIAVSSFEQVFGSVMNPEKEDLLGFKIYDQETGTPLFEKRYMAHPSFDQLSVPIKVNYPLQIGKVGWDLQFEILPTGTTGLLAFLPAGGALSILFIGVIIAFFAQRKHQQDLKMREISKTLEGAHSELQQKTTERDRLFYALRQSERENRALINSVSDVIFETDQHGKILFLNETWKRVTGTELTQGINRTLFDMIDPVDRMKYREMFEELVRGERGSYRVETRLDLGQDKWRSVEIAFSMLRLADQQDLRVVGTITDIEKRRRAEVALREAEQRFRAIFENSVSGIYQSSPEGKFISVNPACAEILGYSSPEDLIFSVTNIAEQIYVRPEERKKFAQKLLFEGTVSGLETELYRKDGKKIWVMENARIVRSEKGAVDYYEGSIWDMTEQHLAEETMRQARIHAEISSRSRMEFLANMSHELRTPLNAVIGFSEIIRDEVMGPLNVPVYKDYAKDIFESGSQLLRIINEILEVSKLEMGTRELNENNFRLSSAIRSCMVILEGKVEQGGIDLSISVPDDLPEIYAERMAIKQIVLNLAGNAIKFTPKGGKVEISAYVESSTGEMVIEVKDTGAGMTEEEIKKAMQPFSKVETSFDTMKEGTGLGLTIVNALVKLHGGTLRLISQKGVGTLARVTLPKSRVMINKPMEETPSA